MTYYALMMIPSSNVIYLAFVIPNGWCWFPCWLFGCHWYLVGVASRFFPLLVGSQVLLSVDEIISND